MPVEPDMVSMRPKPICARSCSQHISTQTTLHCSNHIMDSAMAKASTVLWRLLRTDKQLQTQRHRLS